MLTYRFDEAAFTIPAGIPVTEEGIEAAFDTWWQYAESEHTDETTDADASAIAAGKPTIEERLDAMEEMLLGFLEV